MKKKQGRKGRAKDIHRDRKMLHLNNIKNKKTQSRRLIFHLSCCQRLRKTEPIVIKMIIRRYHNLHTYILTN